MRTRFSESPLAAAAKGSVAGLVGTLAISFAMQRVPVWLHDMGLLESGPATTEEAAHANEQPTQRLAEKVATGVLEQTIDTSTKEGAGQAIHWGYGAAWGAAYGIVQESLHLPTPVHGTLLGSAVGVVASTLVPAMGLVPPPTKQPVGMSALQFGYHLVYGLTTGLTYRLLSAIV